jgi:hypothetical protein
VKKNLMRAAIAALMFALAAFAPLAAGERPYDSDVDKTIDTAYRGLDKFMDEMSSKAKGAKVTRDGVETDISDFLKDFKEDGRLLKERFGPNDMASTNALDFLRKAKATDGFVARHPGFTGADSEWTYLKPVLQNLAGAYFIDWEGDPATWRPVRLSDKTISATLAGVDKQVSAVAKSASKAGKAAKVDKEALKGLNASIESVRSAGKSFRDTFKSKQPADAAAEGFFGAIRGVEEALVELDLTSATSAAMSPLSASAKSLGTAFGH